MQFSIWFICIYLISIIILVLCYFFLRADISNIYSSSTNRLLLATNLNLFLCSIVIGNIGTQKSGLFIFESLWIHFLFALLLGNIYFYVLSFIFEKLSFLDTNTAHVIAISFAIMGSRGGDLINTFNNRGKFINNDKVKEYISLFNWKKFNMSILINFVIVIAMFSLFLSPKSLERFLLDICLNSRTWNSNWFFLLGLFMASNLLLTLKCEI